MVGASFPVPRLLKHPPAWHPDCLPLPSLPLHHLCHCSWDAGDHLLLRYQFKEAPDLALLPPPPAVVEDNDDDDYDDSDDEELYGGRRSWSPPIF